MKDSWGPLKALAAASVVNGAGDIILCCVCGYGIAGAAWATMVSQVKNKDTSMLTMLHLLDGSFFYLYHGTPPFIH
jgi:Na+-driven multidrug efflux pump